MFSKTQKNVGLFNHLIHTVTLMLAQSDRIEQWTLHFKKHNTVVVNRIWQRRSN